MKIQKLFLDILKNKHLNLDVLCIFIYLLNFEGLTVAQANLKFSDSRNSFAPLPVY